jgi:hypothetical protein
VAWPGNLQRRIDLSIILARKLRIGPALTTLGERCGHIQHIHIMNISHILHIVHVRYLEECQILFPFINGNGDPIMATGKNHSMRHTAGDVARYCDAINVSCEAPEEAHKLWVKEQGVCTNQGPQVQLSMMLHSLRKEASALLCEAVQGKVCVLLLEYAFFHISQMYHIVHIV